MGPIIYETVQDAGKVDVAELSTFYTQQGHRTTGQPDKLRRMLENSSCFVTARQGGRLIGIARGVTDGVNGQLAECKLDVGFQGPGAVTRTDGRIEHDESGIAREMALRVIAALRTYGVEQIHVLAYGTEVDFCEELGFKRVGGMVALQMDTAADVSAAAVAQS
jgi:hypothetical protein